MINKRYAVPAVKHLFFISLCLLIIIPFLLVVVNSFKTKNEAARMNFDLPTTMEISNYSEVVDEGRLVEGFFNSMLYASVAATIGVFSSAMAAYVTSRNRTKLNTFLYYFILCGLFFPVNYVTLVRVLTAMGLNDTRGGIIINFISAMIPFCVFTTRNFVSSIPIELDESAVLDGAGPVRLFVQIIAPMMKPVLVTCFILQFMGVWNDFLTPLYLSSSSSLFPMTMAVYQFFGRNGNQWNLIFANIVLTTIPVVLVYLLGQRYIIGGMTSGAVKG